MASYWIDQRWFPGCPKCILFVASQAYMFAHTGLRSQVSAGFICALPCSPEAIYLTKRGKLDAARQILDAFLHLRLCRMQGKDGSYVTWVSGQG